MIDARKGVLTHTKRHSHIVAMIGIRHVVLAINKIDPVVFDKEIFDKIVTIFSEFAIAFKFSTMQVIPISALDGDSVFIRNLRTPWYSGLSLMGYLDLIDLSPEAASLPLRMPVQWVNGPN